MTDVFRRKVRHVQGNVALGVLGAIVLLALIMCLVWDGPKVNLTGAWTGTAYNANFGIEAPMNLSMRQLGRNYVEGDAMITGPLTGGSHFEGIVDSKTVSFVTKDKTYKIMWFGNIKGDMIQGKYTVEIIDDEAKRQGLPDQEGSWFVQKVGSN